MGANLCSLRRLCIEGPMTAATSDDGYAICDLRRLQWWRREKREVKSEKEASCENKQEMKSDYMSLEELLLASPLPSSEQGFVNGGQFNVSRHGGFKRKVHPTTISDHSSSFCERSSVVGKSVADNHEYSCEIGSFSICRSESGKLKKKVSFRLPEVSDVMVFYSPEDDAPADANVIPL